MVQMMVWRHKGDKPLSEPVLTRFTEAFLRHLGVGVGGGGGFFFWGGGGWVEAAASYYAVVFCAIVSTKWCSLKLTHQCLRHKYLLNRVIFGNGFSAVVNWLSGPVLNYRQLDPQILLAESEMKYYVRFLSIHFCADVCGSLPLVICSRWRIPRFLLWTNHVRNGVRHKDNSLIACEYL